MMAKTLSAILLISFLSIGVLGFLLFLLNPEMSHGRCPISVISGSVCPSRDALSLALGHLSGLKNFAQTTNMAASLLVLLAVSLLSVLLFIRRPLAEISANEVFRNQFNAPRPPILKFYRWTTLHEKRDPISFFGL
ncbi:MAG: hypothetical protein AAB885_01310 [Patescibacteria group bacterium]